MRAIRKSEHGVIIGRRFALDVRGGFMAQDSGFLKTWKKIGDLPWELYYFLLIFADRYIRAFLIGIFVETTDAVNHYFYAIEKYTFLIGFAVLGFRILDVILTHRKPRWGWSSFFLALFCAGVLASTFYNFGNEFMYDYMKKLAVSECLIVTLVFFNVSVFSAKKKFDNAVRWCGYLVFFSVLALNILSLGLYFAGPNPSVTLFGKVFEKQALYSGGHAGDAAPRYYGFFTYPTTLGFRCYLACVLGMHLRHKGQLNSVLVLINVILSSMMIVISDTRSGMVAMGIILLFYVYEILKKNLNAVKAKRLVAGGLLAAALLYGLLRFPVLKTQFAAASQDPLHAIDTLSSERLELWYNSLKLFRSSPLFGRGWSVQLTDAQNNTHNLFMTLLAWFGLSGFVPFMLFLISALIQMVRHRLRWRANPYLLCLVFCVVMQSMIDVAIIGDMRNPATYMFWLVIGFFCSGCADTFRSDGE